MAYIWKERDKLSLFADDTIVYLENPKESTDQLLVSKITGCKTNRQKSMKFLVIKEKTQVMNKLRKICSTFVVIWEIQF